MTKEIWKDVPEFEGFYKVSNTGEVKSLERRAWNGRVWSIRPEKVLNRMRGKGKYRQLTLRKNGEYHLRYVHRLVLMAFKPCDNMNELEVAHIDGDPQNNHIDNLYWATHAENMADIKKHGTQVRGEKCHSTDLTECQVLEIIKDKRKAPIIAKKYNTTSAAINKIKRGESWSWLTGIKPKKDKDKRFAKKLNADIARKIYNAQERREEIAVKYGVSMTTVDRIKKKETWRQIHENATIA